VGKQEEETFNKGIEMVTLELAAVKIDHHKNLVKKDLNKHPVFKINHHS
jgi:hypothetical protein